MTANCVCIHMQTMRIVMIQEGDDLRREGKGHSDGRGSFSSTWGRVLDGEASAASLAWSLALTSWKACSRRSSSSVAFWLYRKRP